MASDPSNSVFETFCSLESAPETVNHQLFSKLVLFTVKSQIARFVKLALGIFADLIASRDLSNSDIKMFASILMAQLEQFPFMRTDIEALAESFPGLTIDQVQMTLNEVRKTINVKPMLAILNEVFYAFEPIVIAHQRDLSVTGN